MDSAEQPLAVLAFDHRERAFGSVRSNGMTHEEIRRSKELIFEAFQTAVARGVGRVRPGILVDEQFGSHVARRAIAAGVAVSMPVERAFAPELTFEYGDDYREHLREFRPVCAKALVHYRTTDAPVIKRNQLARLRELAGFLAEESILFMLELIVGQAAGSDGEIPTADADELCASMADVQAAGVHVDLWKVEGLSTQVAAARVAAQARSVHPPASCVVLGAGARHDVVDHWLDIASATPGFSGFAIGRSIWGGSIASWLDGDLSRAAAIDQIASAYRSYAHRYAGVEVG